MQVNIYYGGRGLIDDPTLYTIEKIAQVLDELRVTVERYNLYEDKSGISVLPKTLKDADGVILAASVEWYGIGGYLQQFWMPAGCMVIKKKYSIFICSRLSWLRRMAKGKHRRV